MPPSPSGPASVCLVRLSALGDVIMVLPLVRAIQQQWPETKLTWICGRGVYSVLSFLEQEGVELIPIDKPRSISDYLAFRRLLQKRTFDVLLALQASWRANWLYPMIRAHRKIGYGRDRARDFHRWFVREQLPPAEPHIVDGFLQFGDALGLPRLSPPRWGLNVDRQARLRLQPAIPERYLALNACSSKAERDWLPDRYAQVVDRLKRHQGLDTVLIGGPAEREKAMAAEIEAKAGVRVWNLVGKTNLAQMISILEGCEALLAPDTGAVHIANALGRPVCGLYAVAPSRRTGPYLNNEYCVDKFDQAVRTYLQRDPSSVAWAQRVHHPAAMGLIDVTEVLEKIDLALSRRVS